MSEAKKWVRNMYTGPGGGAYTGPGGGAGRWNGNEQFLAFSFLAPTRVH